MTITEFVPDWSANDELSKYAAEWLAGGSFHNYHLSVNSDLGCLSIELRSRVEPMPDTLRDVPMRSINLVKHNSPVTRAIDGPYKDGNITARVETYVKNGVAQQSIKVTGTNGTTVEKLNQWFDDLLVGMKTRKNLHPILAVSPTVTVRGSGGSGPSFRKMEVVLSGGTNHLVADITQVLAAHFGELKQ